MPNDDRTPQEWREILRRGLEYPQEARTGRRRERQHARKAHQKKTHRETTEWIRAQRRRDPLRPAAATLIVAVLLGLGAGARWLWPDLTGDEHTANPPAASASPRPPTGGQPATPSSSPTPSLSAVDHGDPEAVAKEAVRRYLTRNPPEDGNHEAAVRRAAPLMTPSLVENLLHHDDPAFNRLVSRGGVASVASVKTEAAGDNLPPDTPLRVWRTTTAVVDVEGYTDYSETTVLQVEVTRTEDGWRVSRMLGLG